MNNEGRSVSPRTLNFSRFEAFRQARTSQWGQPVSQCLVRLGHGAYSARSKVVGVRAQPESPLKAAKSAGTRTHRCIPYFVECGDSRYPGASPLSWAAGARARPERQLPKRRGGGVPPSRCTPEIWSAVKAGNSDTNFPAFSATSCSKLNQDTLRARSSLCAPCALLRRILLQCRSSAAGRFVWAEHFA